MAFIGLLLLLLLCVQLGFKLNGFSIEYFIWLILKKIIYKIDAFNSHHCHPHYTFKGILNTFSLSIWYNLC